MRIGLIDADLLGGSKKHFPNLAIMKLSAYHKANGDSTELILNYSSISNDKMLIPLKQYDKIYLSRVFTDTVVPAWVLNLPNIEYGGTGFFFDQAPSLSENIEHHHPDYHLYDKWLYRELNNNKQEKMLKIYKDYSIGSLTKGCFRKCDFCVNRTKDKAVLHSPLDEFLNTDKPKICLLDDNFLAYQKWEELLNELMDTKKPFRFTQGLDLRLVTAQCAQYLNISKYDAKIYFAFDDYDDKEIITEKLKLWREYSSEKETKLYVLVGYDKNGKYDKKFWLNDVVSAFERIKIINDHDCFPYIMRYNELRENPYSKIYSLLLSWTCSNCFSRGMGFREFVYYKRLNIAEFEKFEKEYPKIADNYFDMRRELR